ncbi:MAG: glycosyltransferase [Terriglobia bacterium]|jgi:glycosyltransferase involved in cell wall biosynthesis
MTVSVCIPTFNSAQYLRECIESVLGQTYQDFDLIVSDNASTDATCDIVKSFSDARIRLHRLGQNMGMAFNFNHAASLARGQYIKFLCSDDLLDPACLAKQVAALDRNPQAVMVTTGLRFVDASGRTIRTVSWLASQRFLSYAEVVAGSLIYGNLVGPPSTVLIRKMALLKAGSFSEDLPQFLDVDMWLRLAALGPVGYLPEPLCGFRLHPQTMTMQLRKAGLARNDVLRETEAMLSSVTPSPLARRVAWGRVAGSFLKQALAGFTHGYVKWPLAAVWEALRIDPGFFWLAIFLALFQTGLLGLEADEDRRVRVRRGKTLHNRE